MSTEKGFLKSLIQPIKKTLRQEVDTFFGAECQFSVLQKVEKKRLPEEI